MDLGSLPQSCRNNGVVLDGYRTSRVATGTPKGRRTVLETFLREIICVGLNRINSSCK